MARTFVTARKLGGGKAPREAVRAVHPVRKSIKAIPARPKVKKAVIKKVNGFKPKKTDQKKPKVTAQKKGQAVLKTGIKGTTSDQKPHSAHPSLNECCMFCNNRLIAEAIQKDDVNLLKKLLSDKDNITNPYQMLNSNQDSCSLNSVKGKNSQEIYKLLIKDMLTNTKRKVLEQTLLTRFDRGEQGRYNFKVQIRQLNQARGSKEGNDAFTMDHTMRTKKRPQYQLKHDTYSLEMLKLLIEGNLVKGKKKLDMYYMVNDNLIEYVRQGKIYEAGYLAKFDQENDVSDLNKLYVAALSPTDPLPDRILRISVSKTSWTHRLLSPLHCACINPNPHVLKTFLKICPTFSLPDKNRRNLIHYAAANSNPDIIRFLLANGCDANELDSSRRTPLMIACQLGHIGNVEAILDHFQKRKNAKKDKKSDKQKEKKKKGKKEESEEEEGEEEGGFDVDFINFKDRSSWTALHFAAQNGNVKICEALIDAGADFNLRNSKQMTPVLVAAQFGRLEALNLLQAKGSDLLGKAQKQRKNALIYSAMNGHENIVEYLLNGKLIPVDLVDTSGNTALHYASAYGWPTIVRMLLAHGSDPNKQNLWNTTPASLAIQKYHYLILDIILNHKGVQQVPQQDDQPFLSDAQGRDLVSQHLLSFDDNTVEHFDTLTSLFKRLGIKPKDSCDHFGLNAFHYLCDKDPQEISLRLAQKEEREENENKNESDKGDDEEEEQSGEEEEEEEDDEMGEDDGEATKEERRHAKKYNVIAAQIVSIAGNLEKWGYSFDSQTLSGHTQLLIAAERKNIPMVRWLLDKGVQIKNAMDQSKKRNFLHFILETIMTMKMKGQLDTVEFLDSLIKKFKHSDDLFILAQEKDVRGFTPYHLVLNQALVYSMQAKFNTRAEWERMGQRIVDIHHFMIKIGHKFDEVIPQERAYSFDTTHYDFEASQQFQIELLPHHLFNRLTHTVYNGQQLTTQDADTYGIIDFRLLKIRGTNFFVNYNWLHFLSQIIILVQKQIDTQSLIDLIATVPKPLVKTQIFQESQYMETPFTMGFLNEKLLLKMLKTMEAKDLKVNINGLFRSGNVSRVHLCAYLKSPGAVDYFTTQFIGKDKSLLSQTDSLDNNLIHYAAYLRNFNLLEALIPKADLRAVNSKGNNALHLAVAIKRSNQLELPKIEDLLITRHPQLLVQYNQEGQNPMVVALKRASESKIDPVNLIKVMLDSPSGGQAIVFLDFLGNSVLHIAAQLQNIPLSLSLIYQKTAQKNLTNALGNTPLSEAIKNKRMDNALFLLQSCDDASKIQETVTLYQSYISKFEDKYGVLTEQMNLKQSTDVSSFDLSNVQNVHKLALKKKFFGLYHFSDSKNNPLPILIGALQAKNFVLFSQLLENYSFKMLASSNKLDGQTLLHGLASATMSLESDQNDEDDENDENEEEEEEEQEESEEEEDGDQDQNMSSDQEKAELYMNTYVKLTKEIGLKLNQPDASGRTPLHVAAEHGNQRFIELALQHQSKKDIIDLLNQKTLKESMTVISAVLKSKIEEKVQLSILKKIYEILGNDLLKVNLTYFNSSFEVPQSIFEKSIGFKGQKQQMISIVDVIQAKKRKILKYLVKLGCFTALKQYQALCLQQACMFREYESIKILVEEGKVTINKDEQEKILNILRKPSDLENCWSFSTQIERYLFDQKVITIGSKIKSPFDFINGAMKTTVNNIAKNAKFNQNQIEQDIQAAFQKVIGMSKSDKQDPPSLIDQQSDMTQTHVVHEQEGLQMCTLMMKVDLGKNGRWGVLRYYIAQLLQERKTGQLTLWTRWGRIGERGQNQRTPFKLDDKAAIKEFKKVFKQKSGYAWEALAADPNFKPAFISKKYRIIQLGDRQADKRVASTYQSLTKHFNINTITQALERSVEESKDDSKVENRIFMNAVLDVVKKYFNEVYNTSNHYYGRRPSNDRIFNMALTSDQISEAHDTLTKIKDLIKKIKVLEKKNKDTNEIYDKIIDLNNQYYSLIPTQDFSYSNALELINEYSVKTEFEKLAEIYDFSRAFKISMASLLQHDPISYIKDILPIKLKQISEPKNITDNQELSIIMRYMNASLYKNKDNQESNYVVSNIFRLSDTETHLQGEDKAVFNGLHNHWMLWHGTDKKNLMSILMKGLKIKPPNARQSGSLFGDAIYFADLFSKSLSYSTHNRRKSNTEDNTFYMLLCEVALGNVANYTNNWSTEVYRPPQGYHSVRVMGEKGPDFAHSIITDQQQVYPMGPVIKYPKAILEKGFKKYKSQEGFFAEYLKKKDETAKKQPKKAAKGKKKAEESDVEMDSGSDSELEIDQDQFAPEEAIKKLEDSFLNVKEKKYEVQPNVITTDFCMKRLLKEAEDFDLDHAYGNESQYMVYSEKQVRIRYLLELKFV